MNRNKLKSYAPLARREFIAAVTDRAAQYGLTATKIEPMTEKGNVVLIAGQPFPKALGEKRKKLEARIKQVGFEQSMEAMAYTWFNRLVAIRFMELHGYLEHGFRVLSHPQGHTQPEILEKAQHVDFPGLDKQKVIAIKLDGTKEEELYRLLLTAQCNALNTAMPFLFEKIDDETELLLPDNLLNSDSLIRKLVGEIDEEDWKEVEIIGWLYQFYISEKKDEVIGKVVASEDIPAATQLFTPNWIVKYLVQNTLGRQWLATYPQSALRQQMQYYIEPAEQTPEVQEQLKTITPTSLNPEELTLLDPACGSGHILVEAYDLFKAIYQERGHRARDIPALILQKNLFGLEIDDRAAQLAAFALMMKARADDRRLFESEAKPNILAFQDSQGMDAAEITHALNATAPSVGEGHISQGNIGSLLALFENAKTFGSLIQIPPKLAANLPEIERRLINVLGHGDLTHAPAHVLKPLLRQGQMIAACYHCVVANPPYMRASYMGDVLRDYIKTDFADGKGDLYTAFILRGMELTKPGRMMGMIAMQGWMFLTSYSVIRSKLLSECAFSHLLHLGPRVFPELSGEVVQVAAFSLTKLALPHMKPVFYRLINGETDEKRERLLAGESRYIQYCQDDFAAIPGSPVAYWVSQKTHDCFNRTTIGDFAFSEGAVKTGNNAKHIRMLWEVRATDIGPESHWRKHPKGGTYRKWYGNTDTVVDWSVAARTHYRNDYVARILDEQFWNLEGICWSAVSTGKSSFRQLSADEIANNAALSLFPKKPGYLLPLLGFLNSTAAESLLTIFCTTLNFLVGDVVRLPFFELPSSRREALNTAVQELCNIAKKDWDTQETSSDFRCLPALCHRNSTLKKSQESSDFECMARFFRMKELEEENNRLFIEAYGLQTELSPDVADDQITLFRPDREEDIKRLLSFGIGCMLGRYSLDKPGLIYALGGNQDFDPGQYKCFQADDDGIIPLLETEWGIRDDATNRIVEFVGVAWPKEHLEENLKFIADSLGPSNGEQPRETIRRYLSTGFYKHHLSMYKNRPINWLFSSGKQRAFQCLVYLHRYHEGTLARMRTEYVIPLIGKMAGRLEQLEGRQGAVSGGGDRSGGDIDSATSAPVKRKLEKERNTIKKQLVEIQAFDEKLRHFSDQRIKLNLDNGVKANYARFGDLLAEVRAVTGGSADE